MKTLKRWNYKTHQYEDYQIPDDWKCLIYSDDMEKIVNCPHCGRRVRFGDCFASFEIHYMGAGYSVCPKCHVKEIRRSETFECKLNGWCTKNREKLPESWEVE